MGFKLPPILKQVLTTCVGISDRTRECRTWVLLACANPGNNRDRSLLLPSPQKEQVIQYLALKNLSRRKAEWKRESQRLASSAGELCDCSGVSLPPSLPPPGCALGSSSGVQVPWKVLLTARRRDLSASQIPFYRRLRVRVEPVNWTLCVRRKWCWWQLVLLSRWVAVFMSADGFVGCVTSFLDMVPSIY